MKQKVSTEKPVVGAKHTKPSPEWGSLASVCEQDPALRKTIQDTYPEALVFENEDMLHVSRGPSHCNSGSHTLLLL